MVEIHKVILHPTKPLSIKRAAKKQTGISNGGGHRSDQTSNRDNDRKYENKR